MTDYRTLFDKENLGAWDLGGRDVTVTIASVKPGKVGRDGDGKKAARKPIIMFEGKKKKFVCNVTNATTIANLYGTHVEKWVGKRITIYPTTTTFGRDTVDCVRVRNRVPGSEPDTADPLDREVDPAMRERRNAASEAAKIAASESDEREPGGEG